MDMIVSLVDLSHPPNAQTSLGELLEKATRVLTPAEQAILDTEWVGKDSSKRKLEVHSLFLITNQLY